jgi:hypothetical protein
MSTVLGQSSFGTTVGWVFTRDDEGTYKVTKNSNGSLSVLHEGVDEAAAVQFWNDLNDEMVQPNYTP